MSEMICFECDGHGVSRDGFNICNQCNGLRVVYYDDLDWTDADEERTEELLADCDRMDAICRELGEP